MFMLTDMTDLYHSTDGGNSWSVISYNYFVADPQYSAKIQFTNKANLLYATSQDVITEAGLAVVSSDGGATWAPIATDPSKGGGVWCCIANPQNSNQLIVSDYQDLYFSADGGGTFGTAFYSDNSGNGAYVAGTFFDGLSIYVCTNKGLLVSSDGGKTWTGPVMSGIGAEDIVSFAGAKSGNITRFFCITMTQGSVYVGNSGEDCGSYQNVYSLDYGGSWVKKAAGILSGDFPFYVGMSTDNINQAYLGGSSGNTGTPILLKTTNAGTLWNYVFNTSNNQNIETGYCGDKGDFSWGWAGWCLGMDVSSGDSNTVLITDEGFAHKTTDGGLTWQAVYVPASSLNQANVSTPTRKYYSSNGLENTSCWQLLWYDSLHLFAGYTDVAAIRSRDGGNTWGHDFTFPSTYNTVYYFLKNPSNGVLYGATSSVHDMYQSTHLQDTQIDAGTGSIIYSIDTGKTFQTLYNFDKPVIWLALDPTTPNRMYASVINHAGSGNAGGIWVSNNIQNNASATWAPCSSPARTQGHPFNIRVLNDGSLIATYSGRRNKSGAFTDSSGVFVSTDQGKTWADRSDPRMHYWTMDLVIDPNDPTQNTWYCCVFSGWGGPPNGQGGLYRSINRGLNWVKITNTSNANVGGMSSVYSISFDPVNKGAAYLSTESAGLWYTSDAEAGTPVFNQLQQYPFEQPNRIYFNPYDPSQVWVNSFGNGMEMGSLNSIAGIEQMSVPLNTEELLRVYPNPARGSVNLLLNLSGFNQHLLISITNAIGQVVMEQQADNASGIWSRQIDMTGFGKGIYFIRMSDESGKVYPAKIVLQ